MKIITALLFGVLAYCVASFIAAYFVLLFWNNSVTYIFNMPDITYWQSWFLFMLCSVLIKGTPSINSNK